MWWNCCNLMLKKKNRWGIAVYGWAKIFCETAPSPGEGAVKMDEMKAGAEFEKIGSNFGRGSTVDEMPSKDISCYKETVHKMSLLILETSSCLILRNRHCHPNLQQPPLLSVNIQIIPSPAKRLGLWILRWRLAFFSSILKFRYIHFLDILNKRHS